MSFVALVVAGAIVAGAAALVVHPGGLADWRLVGWLLVLAVVFEEAARRTAFLQLRLSSDLKGDMTSVWGIAGAIALRPGQAGVLIAALLGFVWFRQQRPAGEVLHRKAFNAGAAVLATIAASAVAHAVTTSDQPWHSTATFAVLAAILVDAFTTRFLATGALLLLGARGRALIGSIDNNMLELSTLGLGGLVGLVAARQPWLCVLALVPMTALQRGSLVRELETAATVDSKTGLLNATAWEVMARRELLRAERNGSATSVLIVDVDRFKRVNDRFGHLAGDAVLRAIGRCLADEVREYDSVGRFGGEEFVAVLPSTGEDDALAIAERLRLRINEFRVRALAERSIDSRTGVDGDLENDDVVSVSIGLATSPVDGDELPDLLLAADGALYVAKSEGRNRVAVARRESTGAGELPSFTTNGVRANGVDADGVDADGGAAGQASAEHARS